MLSCFTYNILLGEVSRQSKSYSKLKAERKASRLSKEGYQENTNNDLIQPQHDDSPLRKWSSYSGLSNDIMDGVKTDRRSTTSSSYHGSMENLVIFQHHRQPSPYFLNSCNNFLYFIVFYWVGCGYI